MALMISVTAFLAVVTAIILFGYRRYVLAGRVYESVEAADDYRAPSAQDAYGDFAPVEEAKGFTISKAAEFLSSRVPPSAETASSLQLRLLAAGYRAPNSVAILYGLKLMLMAGMTLMMLLFELSSPAAPLVRLFGILIGVFAGFKLPDYVLSKRIAKRKKKLKKALPDALDLIVVCAEAGLTIDRSFRNVSQQLNIVHPELCEEFSLFTAEISAGLRRKEALENLGNRTQETEVRKFVAVLSQADRFGTSMADALRTHAEYLRVRRRQEAEEKASKVGVKLIFPIFFFIMPCMILVTVGPAAISIMTQMGAAFGAK
jgi:tight adherence protein C